MTVVMEKRSRRVSPARCRLEGWLSRRLDPVPASGRPLEASCPVLRLAVDTLSRSRDANVRLING